LRQQTEALAALLSPEGQAIQSMPDVSPTKWHLAHTSWFFETILLGPLDPVYRAFDPAFAYLFNSYYEAVGPRHPRPERGLLSRPTVDAVAAYRDHVTAAMLRLIETAGEAVWQKAAPRRDYATGFGSSRAASPRIPVVAANTSISAPMAVTAGPSSGCRRVGPRASSRHGRRRSIGAAKTASG